MLSHLAITTNLSAINSAKSCFVEVKGSKIHYYEQGQGKPILFVHGMPSSSFLWRNILPHLQPYGRCIAVDLIGHGQSDSPDIDFSVKTHLDYLTQFIEKLDLKNILIVGHSWGATLGIAYARRHEKNVRAMSYFEPMLGAWKQWCDFNPSSPQTQAVFQKLRSKDEGWKLIVEQGIFLEQIFVNGSLRKLTAEEREGYISPFRPIARRKAAWKAPQELPIEGSPQEVVELVEENFQWQKETNVPQLFFYTKPAAFFTIEAAKKFAQSAQNVSLFYLGKGVYNHAEDYPDEIGHTIGKWLQHDFKLHTAIPKFSFYTNIHKAIRKIIFETVTLAGATDYSDTKSFENFKNKFMGMVSLLRNHSKNEETYIGPLLTEEPLASLQLLSEDHQSLEEQLSYLEKLGDSLQHIADNSTILEQGNIFYLVLSKFCSDYLHHLNDEETKIMPALGSKYSQERLDEVMDSFKRSLSKEESMHSLKLMLAAMNPVEATFMLVNIQKSVSSEIFEDIRKLAQAVVSEDNWEKIDSQLCFYKVKYASNLSQHSAVISGSINDGRKSTSLQSDDSPQFKP